MALGMTMNGAAGTTFDEMRSTLGFGSMSLDQINQGYRDLIDLLLGLDPSVEMGIGNSIWYRQGLPVRADFLERTRSYFDAEVSALDFAEPGAADIINGWVRDATKGKIEAIVDPPIDAATVMFLINAIYFKGTGPTASRRTRPSRPPSRGGTGPRLRPPHGAEGHLPLRRDGRLSGRGPSLRGQGLLHDGPASPGRPPHAGVPGLPGSGRWNQIVGSLTEKEGTVYLPRFRMEWERELNDDLKAMGMVVPFVGGRPTSAASATRRSSGASTSAR